LLTDGPAGNRNRNVAITATAEADNGAFPAFCPELYLDLACARFLECATGRKREHIGNRRIKELRRVE
jgi:hypothetical protein